MLGLFSKLAKIVLSAQPGWTISAYVCLYGSTRLRVPPPLLVQNKRSPVCLFIITNTSPSQEWEAHHGLLELWPFLWKQRRSLYPTMDSQRKEIIIKWRLFCWHICSGLLCCQLAAMTMMTYWQRLHGGHSQLHCFAGLGAGDFCFGVSSGEI